jgi:transcriptional regulator with PAS, ATPase and Fis domain
MQGPAVKRQDHCRWLCAGLISNPMKQPDWIKEFSAAITICDASGIIVEMNDKSAAVFAKDGGRNLIGTNVLDCHPASAREKLEAMMSEKKTNVYTIEKNDIKKLIYQAPWYRNGIYSGFVEMSLEIPFELPHFVRKSE